MKDVWVKVHQRREMSLNRPIESTCAHCVFAIEHFSSAVFPWSKSHTSEDDRVESKHSAEEFASILWVLKEVVVSSASTEERECKT